MDIWLYNKLKDYFRYDKIGNALVDLLTAYEYLKGNTQKLIDTIENSRDHIKRLSR